MKNAIANFKGGILVILAVLNCRVADAASAAVMNDGSSVVVGTYDGELLLWKRGEKEPQWSIKTRGFSPGAQSAIAAVAVLPDDTVIVVERDGNIFTASPTGRVLLALRPFYGYVRLKPDFPHADLQHWGRQVDYISTTRAAFITDNKRYLYLVPNEYATIHKILLQDILQQRDSMATLNEFIAFQFKDHNFTVTQKTEPPSLRSEGEWVPETTFQPSALAACDGWVIVGSVEGYVEFIPEDLNKKKDRRIRQVGDQKADTRSVLDAGCIGENLAYTVSFDTGHGQIQLWDISKQIATSWVGLDSDGHPGMAYVAVPSRDGTRLMSLGDGDVRLWAVDNNKLSLVSKYYLDERSENQIFSAVALASGDFVFSSGPRLWLVPADGGDKRLYAGRPPD